MNRLRQPAGARTSGVAVGGRWASKGVPDINETEVGFHNDAAVVPPHDWNQRNICIDGLSTTFRRSVNTDDAGNEVVTVTTDCDDPTLVLLARKGDREYWSDNWRHYPEEHQLWSADICCQMLEEGLVATAPEPDVDGIRTAVTAVVDADYNHPAAAHVFTYVVAQIRGLRLLQSMAPPSPDWHTLLGGRSIPISVIGLLDERFADTFNAYRQLPPPPWEPDGAPWGPQTVAGHATNQAGQEVFVGEHGDLIWRALTETDHHGRSPLKAALLWDTTTGAHTDMVAAAALYDETALEQLTTGLLDDPDHYTFPGWDRDDYTAVLQRAQNVFAEALNPPGDGECRWTPAQQQRLRSFIDVVEALKP